MDKSAYHGSTVQYSTCTMWHMYSVAHVRCGAYRVWLMYNVAHVQCGSLRSNIVKVQYKSSRRVRFEALKGIGTPPKPRRGQIALYDGEQSQLLIFGGFSSSNKCLYDHHIYNNNKGTYTQVLTKGEMPAHTDFSCGWPRDGRMFVLGGGEFSDDGSESFSNSLHSCNCESGEWMRVDTTGDIPWPRCAFVLWQH